ncbi:hypothetical protein MKX01_037837 [Papaver californicum]|nr:hypothetical protein MKX01_037837 [Papaver californicum]
MSIRSSSVFPSCQSKPQHHFPQLRPTTTPPNNFWSSPKFITSRNLICPKIKLSAAASVVLHDDWPQLLQLSIGSKDYKLGLSIHAYLIKLGSHNETFQGNNLINLYSKFNKLNDAQRVFEEVTIRNTITWTSLMNGYSQNNNDTEAVFRIACNMRRLGEDFSGHTCTVILQACESPRDQIVGEQVHSLVIKSGFDENLFVGTSLLSMYLRSGSLDSAEKVFRNLDDKDTQCLNSMILGYGKEGDGQKSFQLLCDLLSYGLEPSDYTFTNVISSCGGEIGVREGRQLHGLAVKSDVVKEISVGNALVTLYGKYGLVEEAEKMFSGMIERNLVTWTALLSVYVKNSEGEKAISGFLEMLHLGICFDTNCLATFLDGCSECRNLKLGIQIHGFVTKLGYFSDLFIGTALIDLYAKCGNFSYAKLVFSSLSFQTTAGFNAILAGYMKIDEGGGEKEYMVLFHQARLSGVEPDFVTFSRLIGLSAEQASLVKGMALHGYSIKVGLENEIIVGNALVSMYAKCGEVEDSRRMFYTMVCHDLVSWNSLISGCALHGQGEEVLLLFEEMRRRGFIPDEITALSVLQACSHSGLFEVGIHLFWNMESKFNIKPAIEHYACMVDLLSRSGSLSKAMEFITESAFSESPLLWRTLINTSNLHGDDNISTIASKHLLDLVPDDAGSYILISNMYAGRGMFSDAAKVRTLMNNRKMKKDAGCSWIEIENKVHRFFASGEDHKKSKEIYKKLDELTYLMKEKLHPDIGSLQIWDM